MKKQKYYYSVAFFVAIIVATGVGYYFTIKNIWSKAEKRASYTNEIILIEHRKKFAREMIDSFRILKNDTEILQNYLIDKQGEVDFIEYVEKIAREQKLEISVSMVDVGAPKESPYSNLEYLTLKFEVKGVWSSVWNFSRTLEKLPYSIEINSMSLQRNNLDKTNRNSLVVWKGIYSINILKKK